MGWAELSLADRPRDRYGRGPGFLIVLKKGRWCLTLNKAALRVLAGLAKVEEGSAIPIRIWVDVEREMLGFESDPRSVYTMNRAGHARVEVGEAAKRLGFRAGRYYPLNKLDLGTGPQLAATAKGLGDE